MFLALWEYEVKSGSERRFEKVYGPRGDWARLFRGDSHYHETRLVRDSFRNRVYLTLDFWETRTAYEKFIETHQAEYTAIDKIAEKLTVKERKIGWFEADDGTIVKD